MFIWIWETREHKSELTGSPLYPIGHFKWHFHSLTFYRKGHTVSLG